jgi:hypothetical protein
MRALADKHPNTIRRDTEIFTSQKGYFANEYESSNKPMKITAAPESIRDWET